MRIVTDPPPDVLSVIGAAIDGASLADGVIDARTYLRTSTSDETDLLKSVFIPSGFNRFEEITNRAVMRRQMAHALRLPAAWQGWTGWRYAPSFLRIPLAPLISVDEIRALNEDDAETGGTVVDADNYRVDVDHEPGRIWFKNRDDWPTECDRLLITWTCGYGPAAGTRPSDIPGGFLSSILMLTALYYEQRDMVVDQGGGVGSGAVQIPGQIMHVLDEQSVLSDPWQWSDGDE